MLMMIPHRTQRLTPDLLVSLLSTLLMLFFFSCQSPNPPDDEQGAGNNHGAGGDDKEQMETADQKRNPDYLYDLNAVPEIKLTVTEADWNTFLSNYDRNKNTRLYVPARWEMRKGSDVWVRDSVGLRMRGNTSRRRVEGQQGQKHQDGNSFRRVHFGVKFTEYETGERFFGSDRIILKCFREEPTYVREIYCYDLFRRFGVWTAPRASYCRLSISIEGDKNPVYMGVYEMIEGVRKGWLADRRKDGFLPDEDGNLWKAAWGANLSDFNTNGTRQMGITTEEKEFVYSLKTNKQTGLPSAEQQLYNFMEQMRPLASGSAELKSYIEQHIDIDLFLRMMAVNVTVGMWDDYWIGQNNYYFYFDSRSRFYFIPFDYDHSLGVSQDGKLSDTGKQNPLRWGSLGGDRLLCRKVFSIAEYTERYKQYLLELVDNDDYFTASGSAERIRRWQQMIAPYVENDTGEDMTIADGSISWNSTPYYRILSTDETNYFNVRKTTIYRYCK